MSRSIFFISLLSLFAFANAGWGPHHGGDWHHGGGWHPRPGPESMGSDMSIVSHNDLYGNASARMNDAAIVLSSPMTEPQAEKACAALGERLWSGHSTDLLDYLAYEGQPGPFWIAGKSGRSCKTTNGRGYPGYKSCRDRLPALCTQSAPITDIYHSDNSTKWQTTVQTGHQSITGFRDRYSFRFEGVRYAAQPKRFTYSTVYKVSGQSDALAFGPQCVQYSSGFEDCLFLNIWTPYLPANSHPSKKLKPVMLWIHGGGFTSGFGSDPAFDGDALASRGDVVIVTINYRLGTLGFLALDDGVTNGNFGLADQITALEWVQEHIRSFGGDPDRVTIFGQSAGAASVRALLASPQAIGKYAAAIPMSNLAGLNYATTYSHYYTIAEEVKVAAKPILNETGCLHAKSQVDCLRAIDPYKLATLPDTARYLVVDGKYLTKNEPEVTGKGPAAHVPVLMGHMRDDGAAFIGYPSPDQSVATALTVDGFNTSTINPLSIFPTPHTANHTLDIFNTTALVATDAEFRCLTAAAAHSVSLHNVFAETYLYTFNRSYQLPAYSPNTPVCEAPRTPSHPLGDPNGEYFKCHSGELYYVFGSLSFNGLPGRDQNDIPMSQFTLDSWASFARTYNPTPSADFLRARGFVNTTKAVEASGGFSAWTPVKGDSLRLKLLQYPVSPFELVGQGVEEKQCEALGLGVEYYENEQ